MKLPKPRWRKKEPKVGLTEVEVRHALYVPYTTLRTVRLIPNYPSKWWTDWDAVSWR